MDEARDTEYRVSLDEAASRFIKSSKGKDLIVDENNYIYRRERDNKNKTVTYYVCTEKCPVRIHAEYDSTNKLAYLRNLAHKIKFYR